MSVFIILTTFGAGSWMARGMIGGVPTMGESVGCVVFGMVISGKWISCRTRIEAEADEELVVVTLYVYSCESDMGNVCFL